MKEQVDGWKVGSGRQTSLGKDKRKNLGKLRNIVIRIRLVLFPSRVTEALLSLNDTKFVSLPGYPVVNDPLYNHVVFGPEKGKGGRIGKTDEQLIQDLISIHNAENWLGLDEEGGGVGVGPLSAIAVSQQIGGTEAEKGKNENIFTRIA